MHLLGGDLVASALVIVFIVQYSVSDVQHISSVDVTLGNQNALVGAVNGHAGVDAVGPIVDEGRDAAWNAGHSRVEREITLRAGRARTMVFRCSEGKVAIIQREDVIAFCL